MTRKIKKRRVKTSSGLKQYTYLGCPLTRNRSPQCFRLCTPDGEGHGLLAEDLAEPKRDLEEGALEVGVELLAVEPGVVREEALELGGHLEGVEQEEQEGAEAGELEAALHAEVGARQDQGQEDHHVVVHRLAAEGGEPGLLRKVQVGEPELPVRLVVVDALVPPVEAPTAIIFS